MRTRLLGLQDAPQGCNGVWTGAAVAWRFGEGKLSFLTSMPEDDSRMFAALLYRRLDPVGVKFGQERLSNLILHCREHSAQQRPMEGQ